MKAAVRGTAIAGAELDPVSGEVRVRPIDGNSFTIRPVYQADSNIALERENRELIDHDAILEERAAVSIERRQYTVHYLFDGSPQGQCVTEVLRKLGRAPL